MPETMDYYRPPCDLAWILSDAGESPCHLYVSSTPLPLFTLPRNFFQHSSLSAGHVILPCPLRWSHDWLASPLHPALDQSSFSTCDLSTPLTWSGTSHTYSLSTRSASRSTHSLNQLTPPTYIAQSFPRPVKPTKRVTQTSHLDPQICFRPPRFRTSVLEITL